MFVLDAYALLAFFQAEPSAIPVRELIERAAKGDVVLHTASINLAEVLYRTARQYGPRHAEDVADLVAAMPIGVEPLDVLWAIKTARLKAAHPVSLADCVAAALAMGLGATLVTGDRDFERFQPSLNVMWLEA